MYNNNSKKRTFIVLDHVKMIVTTDTTPNRSYYVYFDSDSYHTFTKPELEQVYFITITTNSSSNKKNNVVETIKARDLFAALEEDAGDERDADEEEGGGDDKHTPSNNNHSKRPSLPRLPACIQALPDLEEEEDN